MNDNPLLATDFFPQFDRITPAYAEAAIRKLLQRISTEIDGLEMTFSPTWDGLVEPLRNIGEPLLFAWGIVSHELSVANNDEWRQVEETLQPEIIGFMLRVSQSQKFYQGFCALRDQGTLSTTRKRIVNATILAAEQAGVGLTGEAREKFNRLQNDLAMAGNEYANTVIDAIKAYRLRLTEIADVAGLPAGILALAAKTAREAGESGATKEQGPWDITLDTAIASPFMMHAQNRSLRETLFHAMSTKASRPPHDNTARIEDILEWRHRLAGLLGYENFAAVSLATKMAGNVAAVEDLSRRLAEAARQPAAQEAVELLQFAQENGFTEATLQPWDRSFWAERLSEAHFKYSDEELRAYFQFPLVLDGLFSLAQRLFDIKIVADDGVAPVWHPDVKIFKVTAGDDVTIGWFYLDPYSRPATKRPGAWMNDFRGRVRLADGTYRKTLALMCCNQTPPTDETPSLMRFSEVQTLFHEFGHVLQHVLTTVDEADAAGLNCVEWDAVEIASQFMENWCYDRNTLQTISRHIVTGAPIPHDLFERIVVAKNFMAATAMLRQLYLGGADMDLHNRYDRRLHGDANSIKEENARRYLPAPLLPEDRLLCSFSHIFAGGYAAGYYSYKWSEVLAADAFAAFSEAGLEDEAAMRTMGRRFRDTFLAQGGSRHPMEIFKEFRGREPSVLPLLQQCGLQ